jgi:hypothetical protein
MLIEAGAPLEVRGLTSGLTFVACFTLLVQLLKSAGVCRITFRNIYSIKCMGNTIADVTGPMLRGTSLQLQWKTC